MRGHSLGSSMSPYLVITAIVPPSPGVRVGGNPFHPCATWGLGVRRGSSQARRLGRGRKA